MAFDNTEHVTDRVIQAVGRLPRLQTLFLEVWELSRDALEPLRSGESLRVLQVDANPSDVDFEPLFAHRHLETLRFYSWGGKPRPADADRVIEMIWGLPRLQELVLSWFPASEAALEGVSALQELRTLDLGCRRHVGPAVVRGIATLKELRTLRIGRTPVTNEGLRLLSDLPRLTWLDLSDCPRITGEGVLHLAATKSLEALRLKGCNGVSMPEANLLAEQLPDCLVQLPDGSRSWSNERIEAYFARRRRES